MALDEIIGFVAGFGTTFAAMPDLIAMIRAKLGQASEIQEQAS